jgi:CDP-diacylglycerol--serine O-phosphatidyltransferase
MKEQQLKLDLPRRRGRRTVLLLPSAMTVGNLFCGFFAIISAMHGHFDESAKAIGIAIILDGLDGRMARMANATSEFGLQLDSLADVISFGLAPAILMLAWAFPPLGEYGIFTAFVFLICGTMRLARFNIQVQETKHFVGLAIPAGAAVVAAGVHFLGTPVTDPLQANLLAVAMLILSFLMISRIRYFSLKRLHMGKGKSHLNILLLSVLLALTYLYSEIVLLVLACAYALSGPVSRLFQGTGSTRPHSEAALESKRT